MKNDTLIDRGFPTVTDKHFLCKQKKAGYTNVGQTD